MSSPKDAAAGVATTSTVLKIIGCVVGVVGSLLVYGILQERIMTRPYGEGEDEEFFTFSVFLVMNNRLVSMCVAVIVLAVIRGAVAPVAPIYKYAAVSCSNVIATTCQYEALKYVSFPTQVLAKSCKMVPVMLMGYLVSQRTYKPFEYLVAVAVTAGAMIFKLYETNDAPVQNTEFIGIVLIVAYMGCDSFTSNWQSKIFTQ